MKRWNRYLCALLAVLMCLGVLGMGTMASPGEPETGIAEGQEPASVPSAEDPAEEDDAVPGEEYVRAPAEENTAEPSEDPAPSPEDGEEPAGAADELTEDAPEAPEEAVSEDAAYAGENSADVTLVVQWACADGTAYEPTPEDLEAFGPLFIAMDGFDTETPGAPLYSYFDNVFSAKPGETALKRKDLKYDIDYAVNREDGLPSTDEDPDFPTVDKDENKIVWNPYVGMTNNDPGYYLEMDAITPATGGSVTYTATIKKTTADLYADVTWLDGDGKPYTPTDEELEELFEAQLDFAGKCQETGFSKTQTGYIYIDPEHHTPGERYLLAEECAAFDFDDSETYLYYPVEWSAKLRFIHDSEGLYKIGESEMRYDGSDIILSITVTKAKKTTLRHVKIEFTEMEGDGTPTAEELAGLSMTVSVNNKTRVDLANGYYSYTTAEGVVKKAAFTAADGVISLDIDPCEVVLSSVMETFYNSGESYIYDLDAGTANKNNPLDWILSARVEDDTLILTNQKNIEAAVVFLKCWEFEPSEDAYLILSDGLSEYITAPYNREDILLNRYVSDPDYPWDGHFGFYAPQGNAAFGAIAGGSLPEIQHGYSRGGSNLNPYLFLWVYDPNGERITYNVGETTAWDAPEDGWIHPLLLPVGTDETAPIPGSYGDVTVGDSSFQLTGEGPTAVMLYNPTYAYAVFSGVKRVDGQPAAGYQFQMTLTADDEDAMLAALDSEDEDSVSSYVTTVTSDKNGEFRSPLFGLGTDSDGIPVDGSYTLTVKEIPGGDKGMVYDDTVYTYDITVKNGHMYSDGLELALSCDTFTAGDQTFEKVYYEAGGIEFGNMTKPTVTFRGEKTLEGRDLAADEFSFTLAGEGVNETVKNAADGSLAFSTITLDEEGEYSYTIREEKGSLENVTYDDTVYHVTVTVTEKDGSLVAAIAGLGPDGDGSGADFKNVYKAPDEPEQKPEQKPEPKPEPEPESEPEDITYGAIEGDGQTWTKGSRVTADFTIKRSENDSETFGRFTGIQVDGKDVDAANYTAEAGSLILKLKPAYMETLAVGSHTLKVKFNDGSATVRFTVKEAPAAKPTATPFATSVPTQTPRAAAVGAPRTGDSAPIGLWIGVIAALGAGLAGAALALRRKRKN